MTTAHVPGVGGDLAALHERVRTCRICVEAPIGTPLPHEPRPVLVPSSTARILIAGQAPGTRVHASGRPFTDPSGDRLRDWLGLTPEIFYDSRRIAILPMGFCFPGLDRHGGDLPPRRECAPAWRSTLMARMPELRLVLAIGLYAQAWHLGPLARPSLTETVAAWRDHIRSGSQPVVIPLPHPSWRNNGWIRRNPWFEAELLPEARRLVAEHLAGDLLSVEIDKSVPT